MSASNRPEYEHGVSNQLISEEEMVARLSGTAIFNAVPEEHLLEIARVLKIEIIQSNTIIFRQGDPGYDFYIIHSGKLRVFLSGVDNVEIDLNWLGPGDCFGEMALLTDDPRSTSVEATENTKLLVLAKNDFDAILKKYPEIYKSCLKHVTSLLKHDEKRILEETEHEHKIAKLSILDFIFILVVVVFFATIYNMVNPNKISVLPKTYDSSAIPRITINDAKEKFDDGQTLFVDARPSSFFDKSHIKGAINLPLSSFEISYMYMSEENKDKDLIIYGRSIGAIYDEAVAMQLQLYGHENIWLLQGNKRFMPLKWYAFDAWHEKGLPIEVQAYE